MDLADEQMYGMLLIWNEGLYHKNVGTSSKLVEVIVSILAARSRVKLSSALFFLLKVLSSCLVPKPIVFILIWSVFCVQFIFRSLI